MVTTANNNMSIVGTPYYISPEICLGRQYDAKVPNMHHFEDKAQNMQFIDCLNLA